MNTVTLGWPLAALLVILAAAAAATTELAGLGRGRGGGWRNEANLGGSGLG